MSQLIEFGFDREAATLALYLADNDFETSVGILADCDSDLVAL